MSQPHHHSQDAEQGASLSLADLPKGQYARIVGFNAPEGDLETRLREIGFAEGDEIETLHFGPFGKTPMTVRLNGSLIALRRREAGFIMLEIC